MSTSSVLCFPQSLRLPCSGFALLPYWDVTSPSKLTCFTGWRNGHTCALPSLFFLVQWLVQELGLWTKPEQSRSFPKSWQREIFLTGDWTGRMSPRKPVCARREQSQQASRNKLEMKGRECSADRWAPGSIHSHGPYLFLGLRNFCIILVLV